MMTASLGDIMLHVDKVENALKAIYERETAYGDALAAEAEAEHSYKLEKAHSFMRSNGTEKARDAQSVIDSEKLFLDYLKKRAVKEFTREKLRDAQDALSARQSILSASAKADFNYANSRGTT